MRAMTRSRALHRGGVRQLHVEDQIALVLLRNEAGRGVGELPATSAPASRRRRTARPAQAQDAADRPAVDRGQPVEAAIEGAEEPAQAPR